MANPVGYIVSTDKHRYVMCVDCTQMSTLLKDREPHAVALYHDNIFPYKQSCHVCGAVIVEPRTQAWPELFTEIKP